MQTTTPATLFKNSLLSTPTSVPGSLSFGAVGTKGGYDTAPKPTVPTANVGATTTTPTPTPTVSSAPAKSAYVSSLTKTQSTNPPTQTSGNVTTPSGAVVNPTTGATISTPAPDKNAAYTDAYTKYIQSLTPSDAETSATKNLNNLTLQSQKDQADAIYRNGGTTGSASEEANKISRDESFAIDAASNNLNALTNSRTATTNAAKARTDFEKGLLDSSAAADKEKFTETQATTKATQDQANADRTFEENKREYGLDYAQKAQQIAIDQQKANQTNPNSTTATQANTEAATGTINLINNLLSNPNVSSISGALQGKLGLSSLDLRGDTQLAKNQFNQIKGLLSLENRGKLKGQGAVSDFEGKMLESAASSLDTNLSDDEFKKQLKQVKGAIATSHGLPADVLITDPQSGKSQVVTSNSANIAQAIKDGLLVQYQ